MSRNYAILCLLSPIFLILFSVVWLISISLTQNYILPWLVIAIITIISIILWRYHNEIISWYNARERTIAEFKGKEYGLPTKIKIGRAERVYPSRSSSPPKWAYIKIKNVEIYCKGTGTKSDPYIIDGLFPLPKRIAIYNDSNYYNFKNVRLKKIGLDGSANFTFTDCEFKELRLNKSNDVIIQNTLIVRDSRSKDCLNVNFENCQIKNVILYKSNNVVFKKCFIWHFKDWMSKNNNFETTQVEFLESNKKETSFSKGNIIKDTYIKKSNYKMKRLFYTNLKTELPIILWGISFGCFTFIGLGIMLWLHNQGHRIWFYYLIIPGNFVYFIIIALVCFYINELYFTNLLKKKR